ncbi:NAC domain-containing protein 82-like isoform X2 [Magnolia sinica]|uniref:NAC domain-containing protein 82-like isoform X2 n=1 Tax=Magnolia sinica TaxID=86752 RepID=UPI0026584792|nr:NAC domain-containing protein 82-like isoform X2 [Magnolia sinica]
MATICSFPGVRFHPTDVELVMYYLKRQINGRPLVKVIAVVELYKFEPWDLQAQSLLRSRDLEWYFFCPRDRKYASGSRRNRATEKGFWKTTGNDKAVCYDSKTVGMRKTLIFYEGKAPKGTRTDWVMHEYRIEDKGLVDAGFSQDAYVICKIFQKSGRGPKNGEQHGAQFNEADWEDDLANDSCISLPLADPSLVSHEPEVNQNMAIVSTLDSQNGDNSLLEHLAQNSGTPVISEGHPSLLEDDDTENFDSDKLLSQLDKDGDALMSNGSGINEELDSSIPHESTDEDVVHRGYHEIYEGLVDIIDDGFLELKDLPDPEMDNSRSNPEQQEAICCFTSPCMENAEETAAICVPQFMARDSAKTGFATSDLW